MKNNKIKKSKLSNFKNKLDFWATNSEEGGWNISSTDEGSQKMLENENESMQKSRQIMIGYMKNLNELSKTESKIRHNHYKSYCLMFQFNIGLLIFCSSFYAMLLAINNRTIQHVYYMVYLISLMVFTKYIYDTNKNIQKQNTDLYVELKKIESANDLINDLLDNL